MIGGFENPRLGEERYAMSVLKSKEETKSASCKEETAGEKSAGVRGIKQRVELRLDIVFPGFVSKRNSSSNELASSTKTC